MKARGRRRRKESASSSKSVLLFSSFFQAGVLDYGCGSILDVRRGDFYRLVVGEWSANFFFPLVLPRMVSLDEIALSCRSLLGLIVLLSFIFSDRLRRDGNSVP